MLVSWGLSALLLGVSAAVRRPQLLSPEASLARVQPAEAIDLDIFNTSQLEGFVQQYRARHVLPPRSPAKIVEIDRSWLPSPVQKRQTRARALQQRQETCSSSAPIVCAGSSGSGPVCDGCSTCCPDGAGSFHCCGQGFKCCLASDGTGSCCPDDGGDCSSNGCPVPYVLTRPVLP